MLNKKAGVLLAVLVIVAAGGATALYALSDRDSNSAYHSEDTTGRLSVYGNANNDDYLDSDDIAVLEAIIANPTEVKDHPLADANQDGNVDQRDIDMVKQMIAGETMEIYVLQQYSGSPETVKIDYPITANVCVAGYEALTIMKAIGAKSAICALSGASGNSFDPILYSDVYDLPKIGGTVWTVNTEQIPEYGVKTIITMDSKSYIPNYEVISAADVNIVRITAANGLTSLSGIVTLGFLTQHQETANELIAFYEGIMKTIGEKVNGIGESDRATSLFVTMSNYVEGPLSDYYGSSELAGSNNLADWTDKERQQFKIGEEWLWDEKYQAQFIVHSRALGLGGTVNVQEQWDKYSVYFHDMDAYKNGGYFMLNSALPVVMRIAFMAEQFYPDLFEDGWAEELLQHYFYTFMDNLRDSGYNVSQGNWVVTAANLKQAGS